MNSIVSRSGLLLAVLAMVFPASLAAAQERVDVELVLAVDVSGSMRYEELRQQRAGYVAAFRSPEVINAIGRGGYGRVAVMYVEWARADLKKVIVPWTLISGEGSANTFADELEAADIGNMRNTSISGAIRYGAEALNGNEYEGTRRVIDISGDGANNQGGLVTDARDAAVAQGITINGLPLLVQPWVGGAGITLDGYYRDCVIGGPTAFVVPIKAWSEFPEAVRRKLVLELSGLLPEATVLQAQFKLETRRANCALGEQMRTLSEP